MAANLARAGFAVRAWDRTASQAAALTEQGATVAARPAEAIQGAGVLITMLPTGPPLTRCCAGRTEGWTSPRV
jgi:3-hydroxyisobutyrate dehydrogenase